MKHHILIIEDDQFLIDAYTAKFGSLTDMTISYARDGDEALATIHDKQPDAIILDLVMPKLDGFELLQKLKKEGVKVPILVASNLDGEDGVKKAMDLGASDYFIKSNTSVQDIVEKIRSMIQA